MEDFIDETFASLDVYYPGSKRKRKATVEKPKVEIPTWSARGYVKIINGKEVEFFTIGALAGALGRPIITIRYWVEHGYLPTSTYKMPSVVDKNGDTRQGRWLYTRDMIDTAVDIFNRAGLFEEIRIDWQKHQRVTHDISVAWTNLLANQKNETTAN
jgi:hypothetical protein